MSSRLCSAYKLWAEEVLSAKMQGTGGGSKSGEIATNAAMKQNIIQQSVQS
jgi:hypothetical protein